MTFKNHDSATLPTSIRRIVAVGGDTVAIEDGSLVVNGRLVIEPYIDHREPMTDFSAVHVPAGSVFLMGDNRNISHDSRSDGPVSEDDIVGYVRFSW